MLAPVIRLKEGEDVSDNQNFIKNKQIMHRNESILSAVAARVNLNKLFEDSLTFSSKEKENSLRAWL